MTNITIDTDKVAEIIKNIEFYQLDGLRLKPNEIIGVKRTITKQLADYFEKEAETKLGISGGIVCNQFYPKSKFNPKQFKDKCGVK